MNDHDFTTAFSVDQTPKEAFDAIHNVVDGGQRKLKATPVNSATSFRIATRTSHHCKMKRVEVIPDKKVVWLAG
jgi:hypothetical protein